MNLRRRSFLKTAAMVAAGSALPGCKPQVQKLIPYLLPDDEIVPGIADWYASTCHECGAGCGVLVRTIEGRAKKIEGNPDHPVNRGKLCTRGQAALQSLYHPDRLQGPLKRSGERGGEFRSFTWDEAFARVTEELGSASRHVVMISRPLSGTLAGLLAEFIQAIGGALYWYDPAAELPLCTATRLSFGVNTLPEYDLANADFLLSFGAPFLEQWISPVAYGAAFGRMRQDRAAIRGRFVHIEPRLSLTAASADQWIPIRPGTEGLLAAALTRVVLAEPGVPEKRRGHYASLAEGISLDEAARQTDVPRDEIIRLGRQLASARRPVAIGGGPASAHTNGTQSLMAINSLNAVLGNLGREGGVRFFAPAAGPEPPRAVSWLTEQKIDELVGQFKSSTRTVLLLNDCNPLFAMPPSVGIDRLFTLATFVASFGAFLDESASMADVVCPSHSWLESWDDHIPSSGLPVQTRSLRQPAVTPLYETRQTGDIVLTIARAMAPERFPWPDYTALLRDRWKMEAHAISPEESERLWLEQVQQGGRWNERARLLSVNDATSSSSSVQAPEFLGEDGNFPLHLYPYPAMTVGYQGAHLPWLQELPDTLTTAMWGTWVEMNPKTAARYGIHQGDLVRIESRVGKIEVPAVIFPGIRPDVIAVPIGQGHTAFGRYAKGRGVNPLVLLERAFDRDAGTIASGATRVRIEPTGAKGRIILLQQPALEPSGLIQVDRVTHVIGRNNDG